MAVRQQMKLVRVLPNFKLACSSLLDLLAFKASCQDNLSF
jgi:hypothetical protein